MKKINWKLGEQPHCPECWHKIKIWQGGKFKCAACGCEGIIFCDYSTKRMFFKK